MNVLLISGRPHFPQQIGGREWVIHETVNELTRNGHHMFVMAGLEGRGGVYLRNRVTGLLTGNKYPMDKTVGYPVFRGWAWEDGLIRIVNRTKPDVVIIESSGACHYAEKLKELNIPFVVRMHDTAIHVMGDMPDSFPETEFIAVSEYLADLFKTQYKLSATVIPPPVNKERVLTKSTHKKVVLVNPRFVKGGDIALDIAERCPDVRFKFFEAWVKDDAVIELEKRAKQLPNVEWSASVTDPKKIYNEAHIVLVPSRGNETWGRVVTEAHFNGLPVVASNRGALPESLGPGGILLDPDDDVEKWVSSVRKLWDNDDYYQSMSHEALTFSQRQEITSQMITSLLMDVIDRAIEKGKS